MDDDPADSLNDMVLEHLTCPVCTDYCKPPIKQCANGHNTCSRCLKKLKRCALCKDKFTDVRNKVAELLVANVKYPCRFKGTGCHFKIERRLMGDHLKVCPFAIRCQLKMRSKMNPKFWVPCTWNGSETELAPHVKARHKPFVSKKSEVTHHFRLIRKGDVRLLQCSFQQFWSIMIYDFKTHTMRAMVFLVGLVNDAAHYEFKYELLSKEQKHAIVHQGDVVSLEETKAELMGYFGKFDSVSDVEDNTLLFRGRNVLKKFIDDGIIKCRLTLRKKELHN